MRRRQHDTSVSRPPCVHRHSRTFRSLASLSQILDAVQDLPIPTILVRSGSRPHHVSSARLANALLQESRKDGDIENIAGVDECTRSGFRKLGKSCNGLLRSDKSTVDVDVRVASEVFERDGEGIIGW